MHFSIDLSHTHTHTHTHTHAHTHAHTHTHTHNTKDDTIWTRTSMRSCYLSLTLVNCGSKVTHRSLKRNYRSWTLYVRVKPFVDEKHKNLHSYCMKSSIYWNHFYPNPSQMEDCTCWVLLKCCSKLGLYRVVFILSSFFANYIEYINVFGTPYITMFIFWICFICKRKEKSEFYNPVLKKERI